MVATAELHAWITNLFLHLSSSSSSSSSWWPQPSFTPGSPIHSYTYLHHHHHHGGHSQASRLDHQSISTPIIVIMVASAKLHAWISNLFLHLSSSSLSSWWPQPSFTPGSPIHSYTYHHHHHHHHRGGHGRASRLDHQSIPTPIIIIIIVNMVATAELHTWITNPFLHL